MEDVCVYGHQLAPGSDQVRLREIDEETGRLIKEETKLLRRHVNTIFPPTPMDPRGIGPAGCLHGLAALPVGPLGPVQLQPKFNERGDEVPWLWAALSWMRTGYIRGICCVFGSTGEMPLDALRPADGSFEPRPEDLPEWAR